MQPPDGCPHRGGCVALAAVRPVRSGVAEATKMSWSEGPAVEAARERLWAAIAAREDELVGLVAELVRRPSLLGQETAAQACVAEHLRASGLATESWDLDAAITGLPQ